MEDWPEALYTAEQVRELDRRAMDEGLGGGRLMARAGEAAWRIVRARWPEARRMVVLCGGGNNGGDGYVVAGLARSAGLEVTVYQLSPAERLRGDAAEAWKAARDTGVPMKAWQDAPLPAADVVVDGMLGTGLDRPVEGHYAQAITRVAEQGAPVLALDIPSGLAADTGRVLGAAVPATLTVTFIGIKQGLLTGRARDFVGELVYASLDVPPATFADVTPAARRVPGTQWRRSLPVRTPAGHKGRHGHVLVTGGELGMGGAVRLAGEAALRAGAGLVSAATRPSHVAAILAGRPEIMVHGIEDGGSLHALLDRASVIAAGPGLGREEWGRALLSVCLESDRPLVLDADALNLLAAEPRRRDDWILTPHPGEAARLLGCAVDEVEADRFAAVRALQARYGGVVVLKGAGTLIDGGEQPLLCSAGSSALAVGGSGDVLTGLIAGLRAQGLDATGAATTGVCLHALAGERIARDGTIGALPLDLLPAVQRLINRRS